MMTAQHAIILFDGVCNLCDTSVHFIIDRDPKGYFRFASLQSPAGEALLRQYNLPAHYLDSLVLLQDGGVFTRSSAALRILRCLAWPWPFLSVCYVFPRPLRDALYNLIAANRYRLFGKHDVCRVPTPQLRERFLDSNSLPVP